eukprot:3547625-Amphidinium_carterae.1
MNKTNNFLSSLIGEGGGGGVEIVGSDWRGDACPAWSEALCSMAERAWAEEPTLRPTAEDLWRELCNQLEVPQLQGCPPSIRNP